MGQDGAVLIMINKINLFTHGAGGMEGVMKINLHQNPSHHIT
jgi:hypothetical protein